MNLLRLYPILSFSVVLLAIVAQCLAQRSPWLLVIAGGVAALSRALADGPRGIVLPRVMSLLLSAIALAWSAVVASTDLSQPIPAIGQFVVWLTVIKLYEQRTLENEAERLILALLLMVLGCLVSIDLLFGLLLLLWTGLGIVTLMLFQLQCATERSQRQRAAALGVESLGSPQPVFGPGLRQHYRNISLISLFLVFGISAGMFVIFPRQLTSGLSHRTLGAGGRATVGMTEGVDLMGNTRISMSGAQVMSVGITDAEGNPTELDRPLRLRGGVLSAYRGDGIWGPPIGDVIRMETQADRWRTFPIPGEETALTLDIMVDEPSDQLLSMSVPVGLRADTSFTLEFRAGSQTMRVDRNSTPPLKYEVEVVPRPPLYRGPRLADLLMIRSGYANPRVFRLAQSLIRGAGLPLTPPADSDDRLGWNEEVAVVFERHLKYGSFEYTLDLTDVGATPAMADLDPVERFLIHQKFGHCEYFAAALTGLCHVVGIPARMVTGYVTNRFDDMSARYIVTRADAHAWVEVLGPGPDWKVMDPTPPANVPGTRESELGPIDQIVWFWRWFEGLWRFGVLGYDHETQIFLSDTLFPDFRDRAKAFVDDSGDWIDRRQREWGIATIYYLGAAVGAIVLSVGLVFLIRTRRRRHRILVQTDLVEVVGRRRRQLAARLRFYVAMLDILHRGGVAKPDWQPPLAFAESLRESRPEVAEAVDIISRDYYLCRYGSGVATVDNQPAVRTALRTLRRVLETNR